MSGFTSFLERLGSDFLKSSMIPSMAFVMVSILTFDPILNIMTTFRNPASADQLLSYGVMIFLFTVVLGLTLTALNTLILKLLQGHPLYRPLRFLFKRSLFIQKRAAYRRAKSLDRMRLFLERQVTDQPCAEETLEKLRNKYYAAVDEYSLNYPGSLDQVLATRLGNILKATEDYPAERYGFDSIHFSPRLFHVIPSEYKVEIERSKNELSFHVNMFLFSIFFSFLCAVAILYSMQASLGSGKPLEFLVKVAARYLVAGSLGYMSFRLFYTASVFSARSYSLMLRSAWDLFHLDLLKQLGLKRPRNSDEAFYAWQNLNEFVVLGSRSTTFKRINYCQSIRNPGIDQDIYSEYPTESPDLLDMGQG